MWNSREEHFREKEMREPRESCQGIHACAGFVPNALEGKLEEWPLDCPRGRWLGTNTGHFREVVVQQPDASELRFGWITLE